MLTKSLCSLKLNHNPLIPINIVTYNTFVTANQLIFRISLTIKSESMSIPFFKHMWKPFHLLNMLTYKKVEKYTKIANLEEVLNVYNSMLKGEIAGRVLIDLKK